MTVELFNLRFWIGRSKRARAKRLSGLGASFVLLVVAAVVLGCGWDAGSDHSVRFNPYRTEKEFGRLPPLPKYNSEDQKTLFSWDRDVAYDTYEEPDKKGERIDKLWDEAAEAESDGRLGDARRMLGEYLNRTQAKRLARWDSVKDLQKRRNAATDKLDALSELEHGASESAVRGYLAARSTFDAGGQADEVLKRLEEARSDMRLRDNSDYLKAALRQDGDEHAIEDFDRLAVSYPKSEKREPALFMAAVISMKLSNCYQPENAGSLVERVSEDCRDDYWQRAHKGFEQVMREYPGGRYYSDARGWIGRLCLLAGDRAGALVEYYRMLGDKDEAGRVEALFSLCMVRRNADEFEMERVERTLEREPQAALAYAYHNIYNYALRGVYFRFSAEDSETEKEEQARELNRIAIFATRMMNRFPAGSVGAAFVVRVAEADLELGKDSDASRLARLVVTKGATGDLRAQALWVAGVAEFHLRQYSSARRALTTLIAENPNNQYTEGARRHLAMLAEDTGDIEAALDQYLALDYRYDVAYFVDVLMTPEQLAAFIEKRPELAHSNELSYALGVRYLRERRWNDAKAVFARVKTVGRNADQDYLWKAYENGSGEDRENATSKEGDFDSTIRGVRPHWIDQDLRTANDLERLERQVETAQDNESRAEALYQVASYQFERSLLFYNPLEWEGQRHYLLVDLDERGAYRQAGESQLLFDYMQRHDMAANSLPIFLEVVRRFSNTRAARDALFSAAVCNERLREYNNYWREIYAEGGHAGERMVTYRDVRDTYPTYKFPRGTLGWEPSTRTVNGQPGWDKPPKPSPRPSRLARGVQLVNGWINEGFTLWNRVQTDFEILAKRVWLAFVTAIAWVCHWLWILAMCGWLWFLWRRAREARELLREALAGCKERPQEERDNPDSMLKISPASSVLSRYMNQDTRARLLEAAYNLEYKLAQVVRSKRGVTAVAFYAVSHGAFVILLIRLVMNW
ncbi:MAG TPA: hypothetical protein VNS63_06405 [Blastocatellia bacterium]|nr:hypothetical protein [Blastocatellia bacterium]